MRKFELIGWSIFLIGMVLKFINIPFNTIIMFGGVLFLLAAYLIQLIGKRITVGEFFTGTATVFWLAFMLFKIKFLPYSQIILIVALVFSSGALISFAKYFKSSKSRYMVLSLVVLANYAVYTMPTDTRYFVFKIYFNHEIQQDAYSWDKYSWFLYQNAKYDQALTASKKALRVLNSSPDNPDNHMKESITEHMEMIMQKNWMKF